MSRSPNPRSPNVGTGPKGAQTAFKRGVDAARAGRPATDCPYKANNVGPNELNPGARWRSWWMKGHASVKKAPPPAETPS